jgi:putative transposase
VAAALERKEAEAHAAIHRTGRGFLGPERARTVSPDARATSFEAPRGLNPTFAVGRGHADARRTAVAAVRAFRAAYREALQRWRAGLRSVVFPAQTWWMRVFHGVAVNDDPLVS